jgi:hypothetical protein
VTPSVWEVGWKLWVVHLELGDTPMEADSRPTCPPAPPSSWGYVKVWCRYGSWCRTGYDFLNLRPGSTIATRGVLYGAQMRRPWTRQYRRMPYY